MNFSSFNWNKHKKFSDHSNAEKLFEIWPKNTKSMTYQASILKHYDFSFLILECDHLFNLILEIDTSFLLNVTVVIALNIIA